MQSYNGAIENTANDVKKGLKKTADRVPQAAERVQDFAADAEKALSRTAEEFSAKAKEIGQTSFKYMKENPAQAAVAAVAVGFLAGYLLRGSRR